MNSVSSKGQLKIFLQKFLAQRGTTQSKRIPLYQYSTKDTEFNMLAVLLDLHSDEKEHPVFGLYWAASFCLYVAEKFRREYDAKWSWQSFEVKLSISLSPAERSRLVETGLSFWQRPLQQRENGASDYLGSLFSEGGLPWPLLSSEQHSFGRAIRSGLKRYHEYRSLGQSLSLLMAEHSEYFPAVFRNAEKYQLLAQVVESLMSLAEAHKLNEQDDPAAYLNMYAPDWRTEFPLPLEADNGQSLVNEWLKDAGTRLAERKQKEDEALYFTCRHKLAGQGDLKQRLITAQLEAEIQLAPELETDLKEMQLSTTRAELTLYEGTYMALRLGISYGEVDDGTLRIRLPKGTIRLRRQHPEQVLRLVCSCGGQVLPDIEIRGSDIDWSGLPAVFEAIDNELYLSGCASVTSKASELFLHLPAGYESDAQLSALEQSAFGNWFRITEPVRVFHGNSLFLIEPSSQHSQFSPLLRGAQCLESTLPMSTWKGWPHCIMSASDGTTEPVVAYRVNQKQTGQLINLGYYGAFTVEMLGREHQVLARRKLGVLPADFRVTSLPASSGSSARLVITTAASLSYCLANDCLHYQVETRDGETHLLLLPQDEQHPETLLLQVSDPSVSADPVTLRIPYPVTGASVLDLNGQPFSKHELVLNQLLGMQLWLRSAAVSQETFHLVLDLLGDETLIRRVFRYRVCSNKPVEVSLYSLYDEIMSLFSCSDNQDARVRLRIETSQLLRQLTVYRYAAELIDSPSLSEALELTDLTAQQLQHRVDGADIRAMNLQNPEAEPVSVPGTYVTGVATGYFELPSAIQKEGPWLVYPAQSSGIYFRPKIHIPDFRYCTPSNDTAIRTLNTAARYYHPFERKDIFIPVLNAMAEDFFHSSWLYLIQLKKHCDHLPLSAFESWKALSRHPDAMALAVFRLEMDPLFTERLKQELAVIWEVISVQQWRQAMQRYIQGMVSQFGLPEPMMVEQARARLERLAVHIPMFRCFADTLLSASVTAASPLQALLPIWQNDLRTRHDAAIWPENLYDELNIWLMERPDFYWLNTLSMPKYMKSVTLMPVFAAHLSAGQTSLKHLQVSETHIRFGMRILADFDRHAWYEPVYSAVLANLLQSDTL